MLRALVVLVLLLLSPSAFAQSEADRELAVQLGREGVDLYNEQRFEDAYDRFANAEALVHSPVFVVYMARIQRKRGKWVAALARYDAVLVETLPDDAPKTWGRAQQEAKLERERLFAAIPSVVIDVGAAPAESVSIWIDGTMVKNWSDGPLLVDPGEHEIAGQLGASRTQADVKAVAKQKEIPVRLVFPMQETAPPPAPVPTPVPWTPPAMDGEADKPPGGQRIAGWVLLSVGGVAALASLGVGIGAIVHNFDLEDQCFEDRCPRALENDVVLLDELNRATLGLGIASAVMLITGWIVVGTAPPRVSATRNGLRFTW